MGRPSRSTQDLLTSREVALAADITPRNFALLHDQGLAPRARASVSGKAGARVYDGVGLAHAALIGALHLSGLELLVAGRLVAAFADQFDVSYGKLPSNLGAYIHAPLNPRSGYRPWDDEPGEAPIDTDQDYWLHERLRNRSGLYQPATALTGDFIIDIADHSFVTTENKGRETIKVFSPVSGGLPASPDFRIVGRGSTAQIVAVHEELDSLDVFSDAQAADQLRRLERDYLDGRDNAVTRLRINLSLAIRNAFDRLQDQRASISMG